MYIFVVISPFLIFVLSVLAKKLAGKVISRMTCFVLSGMYNLDSHIRWGADPHVWRGNFFWGGEVSGIMSGCWCTESNSGGIRTSVDADWVVLQCDS